MECGAKQRRRRRRLRRRLRESGRAGAPLTRDATDSGNCDDKMTAKRRSGGGGGDGGGGGGPVIVFPDGDRASLARCGIPFVAVPLGAFLPWLFSPPSSFPPSRTPSLLIGYRCVARLARASEETGGGCRSSLL